MVSGRAVRREGGSDGGSEVGEMQGERQVDQAQPIKTRTHAPPGIL